MQGRSSEFFDISARISQEQVDRWDDKSKAKYALCREIRSDPQYVPGRNARIKDRRYLNRTNGTKDVREKFS